MLKVRKKIRTLSIEEYSLLHAVDFRHRVETSILPALWAGKTVLADRYLFTALARDAARGLDLDWLLHAYSPLLWPDLVIYFSMTPEDSRRRIASTRAPHFYEAGQDVTGIDDPLASYGRFIDRVVTEYNNLSVVFQFVTVDAGDAVYRQHTRVRELVAKAEKRAVARVQRGGCRGMADQVKYPGRLISHRRLARQGRRGRRARGGAKRSSTPASSARSAAGTLPGCSPIWLPAAAAIATSRSGRLSLVYRRGSGVSTAMGDSPGPRSRRCRDRGALCRYGRRPSARRAA